MGSTDLTTELLNIRRLLAAWHDFSDAATRFPPPPTREQIAAAEELLGIPLPAELRCFCEEFRCDPLDRECYLQYDPAAITGLTQKGRANDGWVNPVLRIEKDDWVFYQDGASNCGVFKATEGGELRCVVMRYHNSEDVCSPRFSEWLKQHTGLLMAVLQNEKRRSEKRPFWRFWGR